MHRYVIRRIIMLIPVVIGVSLIIFLILSLTPGDPATIVAGLDADEETIEAVREELGLNDPVIVQYVNYMGGLLKGDLGKSYVTKKDVTKEIMSRFPNTLKLTFWTVVLAVGISIPIGIISATRQYTAVDNIVMVFGLLGVSMPNFWLGLMLILLFSLKLGILPSGGIDSAASYILPAIALGGASTAIITRTTRSSMLEVIRQDYIRTAKAKGLNKKVVIIKHAFKNALIPVITVIGIQFGILLGGAVVAETIFSWPGIGRLVVDSIKSKDTPMVMGCIIVIAISFSIINLIIDLLYAYIDPRIKLQYK